MCSAEARTAEPYHSMTLCSACSDDCRLSVYSGKSSKPALMTAGCHFTVGKSKQDAQIRLMGAHKTHTHIHN